MVTLAVGVTRCPATLALALILFEEEGEGFSSLPERPSFALFFDLVSEVEVLTISGGIGPMRLALVLRFGAFCRRACCSTFVLFLASAVLLPSVECCNLRTFSLFSFRQCYMLRRCAERRDAICRIRVQPSFGGLLNFPLDFGFSCFRFSKLFFAPANVVF